MDSPSIKQTVCKVLSRFQHGKYLVAYVLKTGVLWKTEWSVDPGQLASFTRVYTVCFCFQTVSGVFIQFQNGITK